MIRMQIYLDNTQIQEITLLAKMRKTKKAKVIRALLQKGLNAEKKKLSIGEGLLGLAELGKKLNLKGPRDLSVNLDKYLYEE